MRDKLRFIVRVDVRGAHRKKMFLPLQLGVLCSKLNLEPSDVVAEMIHWHRNYRAYCDTKDIESVYVCEAFVKELAQRLGVLLELVDNLVLVDFENQYLQIWSFLAGKSLEEQKVWLAAHGQIRGTTIANCYEFRSWYGRVCFLRADADGIFDRSWVIER